MKKTEEEDYFGKSIIIHGQVVPNLPFEEAEQEALEILSRVLKNIYEKD